MGKTKIQMGQNKNTDETKLKYKWEQTKQPMGQNYITNWKKN